MPAYKDEERGTWYALFYYTDWQGNRKRKKKRGFKTQREAKAFEREFLLQHAGDPEMMFGSLLELYFNDAKSRLRGTTITAKENMMKTHITPYFQNMKISQITNADIRRWQNVMLDKINPHNNKPYSPTYLRSVNSQLSAIFNFAVEFYGLPKNPCSNVKSIGKKQAGEMSFWTLDEFNKAIEFEDKPAFHLCLMILFWCGLREGECLALTPKKVLHKEKALDIYETYHRENGQDLFGPTKTENSKRRVMMPDFVYNELVEYLNGTYGIEENDRIFYFSKTALNKEMDRLAQLSGVKRIRVHDLRHSHVALLIKLGYRTHAIADRVGDTYEVVERTYAHLYPDIAESIARELDKHKNGIMVPENDVN